ncbi:hypothetical protein ACOBQJ_03425 [Pelotomaculum propionicicum]|uniref:hypothetical protein n=1 Tax=Pelotomaculum propionicicum TaxID=258475 RepID=UPI003B7A9534
MKKERKLYRTGLILISRVAGLPEVINGKNFKILFQERGEKVSDFAGQKEVVIEAGSITRAEIACELIICSMALWGGSPRGIYESDYLF